MDVSVIDPSSIGSRITRAREAAGFNNRSRFARLIGAEAKTLARLERGANVPSLRTLVSISDATGVGVEWLATGEGRGPMHAQKVRRRASNVEVCK